MYADCAYIGGREQSCWPPAGESLQVSLELSPRSLSSVDDKGQRSILAGEYRLSVGSAPPAETMRKSEASFSIRGTVELPQ
jgi:beta-glucosidase